MRDAVAAILVFQRQLFMIRRQDYLRAFPGYHAFPGGKIDPGDEAYLHQHPLLEGLPEREIGALFRELEEELGISLEQQLADDRVLSIQRFGTAVTPAFEPVRFRAHYYKIVFNERPKLAPQPDEIAWSGWCDVRALWSEHKRGENLMVVPVANTVRALAEDIAKETTYPFNFEYDSDRMLPYIEMLHGVGQIPVPSNTLPPATTTNALLVGTPGQRLLIDPSPKDDEVMKQLLETVASREVGAVFISHHHRDHHERAPEICRHLDVPLLCSETTRQRLIARWGNGYLADVDVRTVSDGEVVGRWLERDLICHQLPGHDDGMLGLAPRDMSWFFVADLVEPMTTVVIPEPEGDMATYMNSLERAIALKPRVIIPSHGMPMGGTRLLRKTLEHRKEREQQVLEHARDSENITEIVHRLYPELNPKLMPLAEQNVRQHLRKLGMNPGDLGG